MLQVLTVKILYVLLYPAYLLMTLGQPEAKRKTQFATSILGLLRGYSTQNVDWLLRQSILEAGVNYDSKAVKEDKNVWGMGGVLQRKTTQTGFRTANDGSGKNTIGQYSSIFDSCYDRFLWDSERNVERFKKAGQYANEVAGKPYGPNAVNYLKSVNNIPAQVNAISRIHASLGIMLVGGFIATQLILKKFKK